MVPANDALYVDIEKALSQDDVREMVVPPGPPADVAVATKGERAAYVPDERAGAQKVVTSSRSTRARRGSTGPSAVSAAAPASVACGLMIPTGRVL